MRARIKRDRIQSSGVPEIGKIKIGEKRKNKAGKEYPAGLDYFRATGKYAAKFNALFDEPPSTITITFFSDDLHEVCYERLEIRDSRGKRYAYGDGETFQVWAGEDYETFTIDEHPDLLERVERKTGTEWAHVLDLRFLVPQLSGVLGHWHLHTKGTHSSIPAIRDTVDHVQASAGTLWRIPFDLQVEMATSQKPGQTRTFPVLRIVPNVSDEALGILAELTPGDIRTRGLLDEHTIRNVATKQIGAGDAGG